MSQITFAVPFAFRKLLESLERVVKKKCFEHGLTTQQTETVVLLRKAVRKKVKRKWRKMYCITLLLVF